MRDASTPIVAWISWMPLTAIRAILLAMITGPIVPSAYAESDDLRHIRSLLRSSPESIDRARFILEVDRLIDPSIDIEQTFK